MVISYSTCQKEEKERICVKYLIYAVLSQFQICHNFCVFSAKSVLPKFQSSPKQWFFHSLVHYTCNIRYNNAQYSTIHYTTLHYTTLHCTSIHYTTLHYTEMQYNKLHYTTLQYTTLNYTKPHFTTLHYTTLHYTTLLYVKLHNATLN